MESVVELSAAAERGLGLLWLCGELSPAQLADQGVGEAAVEELTAIDGIGFRQAADGHRVVWAHAPRPGLPRA